jgi:hypothetical protein
MCIYCLYIIYLVCFIESIIFASGFQCSILCFAVLAVDDRHVAFCEYNGSVAEKTTGNNQFDPLFKIILDIIHRSNHCLQRVLFEVDFLHNKRSLSDALKKCLF